MSIVNILSFYFQFVSNNLEKDCCIKEITVLLQGYTCTDSTVLDSRINKRE